MGMTYWQAVVLGLVEGATEYLPVSSTGHLLMAQRLMGIPSDAASNTYIIVIQAGAIAAVASLYRQRLRQVVRGSVSGVPGGRALGQALVIAFLPLGVVGLLAHNPIEKYLFGPWPVVIAWALGGVLLLWIGRRLVGRSGRALEAIDGRTALVIGLFQCAAVWPGVSRSLVTILGGVVAGLSMLAAVEFSLLLGLVTLSAASGYKLLEGGAGMFEEYGVARVAVGFAVAWLSGIVAVRWMVAWLAQHGLGVFGWWRLCAAALACGVLLHAG